MFGSPSLVIGDFNAILSQSKKQGGKPFASSSLKSGLKKFMEDNRLVDLGFCEPKFTWNNNRHGWGNIKERLDRGVANHQWTTLFPNATIRHLPTLTSDHASILLDTMETKDHHKTFTFEEFWV